MYYQVIENRDKNDRTAFRKAPADVAAVARKLGFVDLRINPYKPATKSLIRRVCCNIAWRITSRWLLHRFRAGDVLLLQRSPSFLIRRIGIRFLDALRGKGVQIIFFVHDIGELREQSITAKEVSHYLEFITIEHCSVVVVHNSRMRQWLLNQGISSSKIMELGVFDYLLHEAPHKCESEVRSKYSVVIAGNLSKEKSGYLNGLKIIKNIEWRLFGPNCADSYLANDNVMYWGSFCPEELPNKLLGDFGLVWDGDSTSTCSGATGEYLKWNNPHKFSLYMASGMPVIVWKHAAIAEFVVEHGIGIVVNSLSEIPNELSRLSNGDIHKMKNAVKGIQDKIISGFFTAKALHECTKCFNGMVAKS